MYVHCRSYFSLRYGMLSVPQLLEEAYGNGIQLLALADRENTSGCLEALKLAEQSGIHVAVGSEILWSTKDTCVLLARNNKGFQEINAFLSAKLLDPTFDILPSSGNVFIIYPEYSPRIKHKTHWEYYEKLGVCPKSKEQWEAQKPHIGDEHCIWYHPVTFAKPEHWEVHKVLRAIDTQSLIAQIETDQLALPREQFLENTDHVRATFPKLTSRAAQLLTECKVNFSFDARTNSQNLKVYSTSTEQDIWQLKGLRAHGLHQRYDTVTEDIRLRLEKELDVIQQLDFVPYFLVNWDIVQYAKWKGYFYVGRGSGANSIVAYLLGITDVDPVALDLYFERFLNSFRSSPPDFDIDFSWRDRRDVTEYIFHRFGTNNTVALLATYNTFQRKGAIREVGKVFGISSAQLSLLTKKHQDISLLDDYQSEVLLLSERLIGLPNHLSVHSGGILITEKDIHQYSATFIPPKGFPTVQFDMVISEEVGIHKYDILAQRGLSKIKEAQELVRRNQPHVLLPDIHDVQQFIQDPQLNNALAKGNCLGCFYIESPAMRMVLQKLQTTDYPTLVAASSIIRPGVSQSGMMKEYIVRHRDPSKRERANSILLKILPETYGVMVYQEDVLKVAHQFAHLTLAEADVLRRGMSGKYRSKKEFEAVENKFYANCKAQGYSEREYQDVWRQIASFAGYAFAKGHSASYAVESYQSLFFKVYFPLEFAVAVVNNGGGYFRKEVYLLEAQKMGARLEKPCIVHSQWEYTIQGNTIFIGFSEIARVDQESILTLLDERKKEPFKDIHDVIDRVPIGRETLEHLISADVFRVFGTHKKQLLWIGLLYLGEKSKRGSLPNLLPAKSKNWKLPELPSDSVSEFYDELESFSFPLISPFTMVSSPYRKHLLAIDFRKYSEKKIRCYGYLLGVKPTTTTNGKRMAFGTFFDSQRDWIDTVHFPDVLARFPFRGTGVYELIGSVVYDLNFPTIEVEFMQKIPYKPDSRYSEEIPE